MATSRAFPFRRPPTQAPRFRLFCLPYAGGGAALYRPWIQRLAPDIDVVPIELPGRGTRMAEPPTSDMKLLADALAHAMEPLFGDVPVALFGHSMGARIAFELARRFDGRVRHLFASASLTPGTPPRYTAGPDRRPTMQLDDAELKQRLIAIGGTPAEIMADADLMARVMPLVRADFTLLEGYRPAPDARVACPITMFVGDHDPGVSPPEAAHWGQLTTAGCRLIELAAGHFYLESHRDEILDEIRRVLA
ncbi:MAG TPA: alpha/beta fold hydrolase [Kofleriaceae bacterium]|nr:alpha/beta fold hydrolase [Kofleriaceae bacterium]